MKFEINWKERKQSKKIRKLEMKKERKKFIERQKGEMKR